MPMVLAIEHLQLAAAARIAKRDAEQEAVELGFGQWKRSLVIDRVLGGQHDEGLGQPVRHPVDRDLRLLHRLQQGRLRLRGRAVDLVCQHHLRNDRPGPELERPPLLVVDVHAGDIARQEVGRELDALEATAHAAGDGFRQYRLANAGYVLDQDMPATEQRHEHQLHLAPLADDDVLDVVRRRLDEIPDVRAFHEAEQTPYVAENRVRWKAQAVKHMRFPVALVSIGDREG